MQSVDLVQGGDGKWRWPPIDRINAALAAGGLGDVCVLKIEAYSEDMAKRGYAKVFCVQDAKLSSAYRSFFGEGEHTFNNCLLIAPAKSAHRVDIFTLRWFKNCVTAAKDGGQNLPDRPEGISSQLDGTERTDGLEAFYPSH